AHSLARLSLPARSATAGQRARGQHQGRAEDAHHRLHSGALGPVSAASAAGIFGLARGKGGRRRRRRMSMRTAIVRVGSVALSAAALLWAASGLRAQSDAGPSAAEPSAPSGDSAQSATVTITIVVVPSA